MATQTQIQANRRSDRVSYSSGLAFEHGVDTVPSFLQPPWGTGTSPGSPAATIRRGLLRN